MKEVMFTLVMCYCVGTFQENQFTRLLFFVYMEYYCMKEVLQLLEALHTP